MNDNKIGRIGWLDVAKGIGIFLIYLGHCGSEAGKAYPFVFTFHVPLFFFLSGCTENIEYNDGVKKGIWKKIIGILIPYYMFGVLSLVFNVICEFSPASDIGVNLYSLFVKGAIRNQFCVGTLWFLSCLFVMGVMFQILKMIKQRWIIFIIGLVTFYCAANFIVPNPVVVPHWNYNIDSMLFYIVFYIIGYLLYPIIQKMLELNTTYKKVVFTFILLCSLIYTAYLYAGLDVISSRIYNGCWVFVVQPCIVIIFVVCISHLLRNNTYIKEIGKNTLYICGNDMIVKSLIPGIISMVGLSLNIDSVMSAFIYSGIQIIFIYFLIIPFEKPMINFIEEKLKKIRI